MKKHLERQKARTYSQDELDAAVAGQIDPGVRRVDGAKT